ncbi:MAG: enoyl-CoA hydratase/isomerase family protein [Alphaproteobacteria bacterium]|nr:enoyl-CoA hydratase/isomerase family protein [Alphaproteobacteria bacterium]
MEFAGGRILAESAEGIGLLTFNQPEKHNAMSIAMWTGLGEALDWFAADSALRVLVVTGAGERAFVSGADIGEFDANRADAAAQAEYERRTAAGRMRLAAFPRPVIARIRGYCLGGGVAVALAADLRIAGEGAVFGIPAARLGVAYGADLVRALVDVVGPAQAKFLLYSGQRIDAAEAARIGLVNRVVADAALAETVESLARAIAANAPLSIRAAKLAIAAEDPDAIAAAIAACFDSADYREGRAAFAAKRPPRFQGR